MLRTITLTILILFILTASIAQSGSKVNPDYPLMPHFPFEASDVVFAASPCMKALTQRAVCSAANKRALEIMRARRLKSVTVVQDVRTGALVAFGATHPSEVDITTPISPLSLSKLFLSASWWDNRQPDSSFDSTRGTLDARNPAFRSRVTIHEMLVGGSDSAGRQAAVALRKSVGTRKVLEDFARYGLRQRTGSLHDDKFWGELAPVSPGSLIPASAYVSLNNETKDDEWAETLSLGEANISVTALHISRFLQAVGNGGVLLPPVARHERPVSKSNLLRRDFNNGIRMMEDTTALRLRSAMRDTVQRGTAKSIAKTLEDTDWTIGGKTGSGPAMLPRGDLVDGWFAGLIFDPQGRARFTVATFVRSGGKGGENAAQISAALARYLVGRTP